LVLKIFEFLICIVKHEYRHNVYLRFTIKPVLRGHLWDNVNAAL